MSELFGFLVWLAVSVALSALWGHLGVTLRERQTVAANRRTEPPTGTRTQDRP